MKARRASLRAEPAELERLAHLVGERVHEVWMEKRLAEGWRYGPERNDARKEHPCLVPYDALPEEERDYDRATARTVIEALLAEGYEIVPPSTRTASERTEDPPQSIAPPRPRPYTPPADR